jgi:hypothetical protein
MENKAAPSETNDAETPTQGQTRASGADNRQASRERSIAADMADDCERFRGVLHDAARAVPESTRTVKARRLNYLQYLDNFDNFAAPQGTDNRDQKLTEPYFQYVKALQEYLESFMRRTKPLENLDKLFDNWDLKYEEDELRVKMRVLHFLYIRYLVSLPSPQALWPSIPWPSSGGAW